MATEIIMPALGMAQETGTLVHWLRRTGDPVAKGDPIMEVETDKATVEVESPATGVVGRLLVEEGESVPVGGLIGHIVAPGELEPEGEAQAPARTGGGQARADAGTGGVAASPKARRLAAERGLDLSSVRGSGPDGAVLAADLELGAATAAVAPTSAAALPDTEGRTWRLMAERTTASWTTTPHFFLTREVDASRLVSWLAALKRGGLQATHSDLLVYLAAAALRRHPAMNSSWRDGRAVRHEEVNVCLAVAIEEGLVAPVIADADRIGVAGIVEARARLVEKARAGRLRPADLEGGTFSISNLGMYGVDSFNAILYGSQAGILAVGRIVERVVAVDRRVEVRPQMALVLSCDHRLVDGANGARFLGTLADLAEEPLALTGEGAGGHP